MKRNRLVDKTTIIGWVLAIGMIIAIFAIITCMKKSTVEEKPNETVIITESTEEVSASSEKVIRRCIWWDDEADITESEETAEIANAYDFSDEEMFLFERIVFAESATQPIEVQIGVANVILNRIKSEYFPNTLEEVIFQSGQFSPAKDGDIWFSDWKDQDTYEYRTVTEDDITDSVREAVKRAISGENPIGDRIGFYAPRWCSEEELAYRENISDKLQIADIVFHGAW